MTRRPFSSRASSASAETKGTIFGGAAILQNVTRLRLVDELKTNLVSTVSHELKTPLTSVRMALHLLLEESIGELNSKQSELLIAARDDSERLLIMINDLLDLARLEAGTEHMMIEPRTPGDMVTSAIADEQGHRGPQPHPPRPGPGRGVAPAGRGRVAADLPRLLESHPQRRQTLPARARRSSSRPRARMAASAFPSPTRGRASPPKYQPYLFEKFYRVPGAERTGAGLGLSIAREIVRAHHGSIGVKSVPGQGAEFYFDIPFYDGATRPAAPQPAPAAPPPSRCADQHPRS